MSPPLNDKERADLVAYLDEDSHCRAIACVFEGMSRPQRLLEAAELAWNAGKPLIIHKIATGQLDAQAAISHTGSLAGSDAAYRAAFERVGAIVIENFEGLMEAAAFFAKAPAPKEPARARVGTRAPPAHSRCRPLPSAAAPQNASTAGPGNCHSS